MVENRINDMSGLSLAGQQLGNWLLVKKLGEGGMSVIYEARHLWLPRISAIKVMKTAVSSESNSIERFQQEAFLVGQLKHNNIVHVQDFGYDREHGFFMVMDLLRGSDLKALLEYAPLPKSLILSIAEQICAALSVAHSVGVIHRDLKPSNIYLLPKRPMPGVRLLDFGIAKLQDLDKGLTGGDEIMGTVSYLSPEQLAGFKNATLTPRVDIYGLGVLLYQLFTGELPFRCNTVFEHMQALLGDPPPLARQFRPCLEGTKVEVVLHRLLAKKPTDRPASAELALDTLRMACSTFKDPLEEKGKESTRRVLDRFWEDTLGSKSGSATFMLETSSIKLSFEKWREESFRLRNASMRSEAVQSTARSLEAMGRISGMGIEHSLGVSQSRNAEEPKSAMYRAAYEMPALEHVPVQDDSDPGLEALLNAEESVESSRYSANTRSFDAPPGNDSHQNPEQRKPKETLGFTAPGEMDPKRDIQVHDAMLPGTSSTAGGATSEQSYPLYPAYPEATDEDFSLPSQEALEAFGPLEEVGLSMDAIDAVGYVPEEDDSDSGIVIPKPTGEAQPFVLQSNWALSSASIDKFNKEKLPDEKMKDQLSSAYQEHSSEVAEAIRLFHSRESLPAVNRRKAMLPDENDTQASYVAKSVGDFRSKRLFWSMLWLGGCFLVFLLWVVLRFPQIFGR